MAVLYFLIVVPYKATMAHPGEIGLRLPWPERPSTIRRRTPALVGGFPSIGSAMIVPLAFGDNG